MGMLNLKGFIGLAAVMALGMVVYLIYGGSLDEDVAQKLQQKKCEQGSNGKVACDISKPISSSQQAQSSDGVNGDIMPEFSQGVSSEQLFVLPKPLERQTKVTTTRLPLSKLEVVEIRLE